MSDERIDRLSQTLRIIQRRKGHRATSDDTLLAWAGLCAAPNARRLLDLGTGKGTVAMLWLSVQPEARCVGVEAFAQSHELAVRNAALNGLDARFEPRLADLREFEVDTRFDLVLGAPPFMPVGTGVMPQDPQRAAGRFELRGGVEAYAHCAARHLAADGVAVILMDGHGEERARNALLDAGLQPEHLLRVCPRPNTPPTYAIWRARPRVGEHVLVRENNPNEPTIDTMAMRVGESWSPEFAEARRRLALD